MTAKTARSRRTASSPRLVVLLLALASAPSCERAPARQRPNLLLLGLDTVRADALGCYGAPGDPTPNLDRLAAEGALFLDVTSAAPWTLPSFASLFTGLDPDAHGVQTRKDRLPSGAVTLAEILAAAGYDTAAFTAGGHLSDRNGLQDGFAVFDSRSPTRSFTDRIPAALAWLDARRARGDSRPFFLFVHGYDAHAPYAPRARPEPPPGLRPPDPAEADEILARLEAGDLDPGRIGRAVLAAWTVGGPGLGALRRAIYRWRDPSGRSAFDVWRESLDFAKERDWLRRCYDRSVAEMDEALGRLFSALERRGLLDRTLVVAVADHGEEFMEHGGLDHLHVHPEVTRVPWILRWPAGSELPRGVRCPTRASTLDLLPTVLDALRVPLETDVQGRSLLPALAPERRLEEKLVVSLQHNVPTPDPEVAALRGRWRLRVDPPAGFDVELFDVSEDPICRRNVASERPETVRRLLDLLAERRTASRRMRARLGAAGAARLDREHVRDLEALGYVGGDRSDDR